MSSWLAPSIWYVPVAVSTSKPQMKAREWIQTQWALPFPPSCLSWLLPALEPPVLLDGSFAPPSLAGALVVAPGSLGFDVQHPIACLRHVSGNFVCTVFFWNAFSPAYCKYRRTTLTIKCTKFRDRVKKCARKTFEFITKAYQVLKVSIGAHLDRSRIKK